jgi:hypothetical protein
VSKHDPDDVNLGDVVRKTLFKALQRDRRTSGVLRGDHQKAVAVAFRNKPKKVGENYECLSSDLTSASDLLPLDLIKAFVEGILDAHHRPDWFAVLFRRLTGPQELTWPNGETMTTTRGILMGLPTTWFLLSLCHLFWVEEATAISPGEKHSAAICGDDLEAFWSKMVIDRYHTVLNQCGGQISQGKHFVFPRTGCFTEKCFAIKRSSPSRRVPRQRGGCESLLWFKAISLKGLVNPKDFEQPRWFNLGTAVEGYSGPQRLRADRVAKVLYPGARNWFQERGISHAPRWAGGSGLGGGA